MRPMKNGLIEWGKKCRNTITKNAYGTLFAWQFVRFRLHSFEMTSKWSLQVNWCSDNESSEFKLFYSFINTHDYNVPNIWMFNNVWKSKMLRFLKYSKDFHFKFRDYSGIIQIEYLEFSRKYSKVRSNYSQSQIQISRKAIQCIQMPTWNSHFE